MTVREMIKFLQAQPQDNEVVSEFTLLDGEKTEIGFVPVTYLQCIRARRDGKRLLVQDQSVGSGELVTVVRS